MYLDQNELDSIFSNPISDHNSVVANLQQVLDSRGIQTYNAPESRMGYELQRQEILASLSTPEGRAFIAESMSEPLRSFRDYTGVARRAFETVTIGQGMLPLFDLDIDTPAYVVGEEESDPVKVIRTRRVHVPLKEIATEIIIPFTQLRESQFDLQERVKQKVQSEIVRVEDAKIFTMMKTIAEKGGGQNKKIVVRREDYKTLDPFSSAVSQITQHGDITANFVFMNSYNFDMFRHLPHNSYLDMETSRQLLQLGYVGKIFGLTICTTSVLPRDTIFVTGDPKFLGKFIIAQDLTILNADEPKNRSIGFSVFEQIGLFVHNANALVMIQITD